MQYRIGEFARLSGISIKTLRFYDRIGLFQPAAVDPRTRYRLYVPQQLQDLAAVLALRDLGASLNDIRRVVRRTASMEAARRSLVWIDDALGKLTDGEREIAVLVKQRAAIRVASCRAQVKCYADIGQLERDLQRAVVPGLAGRLQGVLWHRCAESGSIEGEPFVEISRRAPRSADYELKELPSATVATAYCESDERAAERAYEAIDRWVRLHDYRVDGPKQEIYVGQILEIRFPVKPR